jgi:hypothetical protein
MSFLEKAFPLTIYHLEELSTSQALFLRKVAPTACWDLANTLTIFGLENGRKFSAKLPTTTITYRSISNYFMIRSRQTQRSESLSELEFLNNLWGLGTE